VGAIQGVALWIPDRRVRFDVAVDCKHRAVLHVFSGVAAAGAGGLELAFFRDFRGAGVWLRSDVLLRERENHGQSERASSLIRIEETTDWTAMEQSKCEPDRRSWQPALKLALSLRLGYSLFAAVAAWIQPVNWRLVHSNALTENLPAPDHSWKYLLLGVWSRFDTLWYLHIAAHGYDRPDAVVFFPLYPGLIRLMSPVVPPMAAALLISTVAAFLLFWGLQELLIVEKVSGLEKKTVWLSACWPAGFILFAGYPESLLLALTIWCLWMGRRERWVWAAALGVAAALTKAIGVVVLVPLLAMSIRQRKPISLVALMIPAVVIGYFAYLHWTGHAGLSAVYAQYWRTVAAPPWTILWLSLRELVQAPNAILVLNVMAVVIASALASVSGLRIEYILFSFAAIVVLLCKETMPPLQSMMRYQLFIFPAFVGMARLLGRFGLDAKWGMVCAAFLIMNLGLLWLFLGWSLVV
jgi:hypothetical protein